MSRLDQQLRVDELSVSDDRGPLCRVKVLAPGVFEITLCERSLTADEWMIVSDKIHEMLMALSA